MSLIRRRSSYARTSARVSQRRLFLESLESRRVLAPIPITSTGVPLGENFDTLASTGTSSTLPAGWELSETGTGANTTYTANNGGSTAGDTYSYGATGSSERALGGLRSGAVAPTFGVSYVNNTGFDLTSFNIQYVGEQWRVGALSRDDRLDFQYSLNATSLTTGTWIDVNALDFSSIQSGTVGSKDGNSTGFQRAIAGTVGVTLPVGSVIYFRWNDFDPSGADDGMAVDSYSLTASGTPSLSVSIDPGSISKTEGNGTTFQYTVTRSGPTSDALSVDWSVAGTGLFPTSAGDFSGSVSGTLSFASGQLTRAITVTVASDSVIEPDESFAVTLSNASNITSSATGVTIGVASVTSTIINDDLQALAAGDILITGINTSTLDQFSFVPLVDLVGNLPLKFTDVGWDASLTTPALSSNEGTVMYVTPAAGLAKGTKVVVEVPLPGANVLSGPGQVSVFGSFGLNATGDNLLLYQGVDSDPQFVFGITTNTQFLPAGSGSNTTTTSYLPPTLSVGTSALAVGTTTAVANAQYNHNLIVGSQSTLQSLVASSAQWATSSSPITLNTSNFTVSDVTQISIQSTSVSAVEGTGGTTNFTFNVTRSGNGLTAQSVNYTVGAGASNPVQPTDFVGDVFPSGTINFPADGTLVQTITIPIKTDSIVELNESFIVQLSSPSSGAVLGNASANGVIQNDDYQTILPGQVFITGVNATNPDQFSFVPTVDLVPFTQLSFTDNAWTGSLTTSGFSSTEGTVVYTVPAGGLSKGTKVVVTVNTTATVAGPGDAVVNGNFALNAAGDNLFVYYGLATNPQPLFGVNLNASYLTSGTTSATTTYLPAQLQVGLSAVEALGGAATVANIQYDHSQGTSGSATTVRDLVASSTNWLTSATAFVLNTDNFTISDFVTPTVTITSAASVTYAGTAYVATASVTGDANPSSKLTFTYYSQPGGQGTSSSVAPVNAGSYSVVASYAGDAALLLNPASSAPFNFAIDQKVLNATASVANKIYDGSNAATVSNVTFGAGEVISGDSVSATVASATFNNRTVANAKPVAVSLSGLAGNSANNYRLASNSLSASASITVNSFSVSVNGGAAQRSQLTSITLQFAAPLVLAASDLQLTNLDGFATPTTVSQLIVANGSAANSFVITFGTGTSIISRGATGGGNSLADGNYRLAQADNGNSQFGNAAVDRFFRLFGDNDGDGDVDGTDATAFRRAQSIYNAAFDADGNGTSNGAADTSAFTQNYGKRRRAL